MGPSATFVVVALFVLFGAGAVDSAAHGAAKEFKVDVALVSEFYLPTTVGGSPKLSGAFCLDSSGLPRSP